LPRLSRMLERWDDWRPSWSVNNFPHLENVVEFHVHGMELTQGEPSWLCITVYCNLTEGRRLSCFRNIRGLTWRKSAGSNDSKNSLLPLFWGQAYHSVTEGDDQEQTHGLAQPLGHHRSVSKNWLDPPSAVPRKNRVPILFQPQPHSSFNFFFLQHVPYTILSGLL
jgi:hypothetical protein